MFDGIPTRFWLLLWLALIALPAAKYVLDYVRSSPRYHDITKPHEDLSWRTRRRLMRFVALLILLFALAIFISTPLADQFARSGEFLPALLTVLGGFALYSVTVGLREGRITPIVRGFSREYRRQEQPKRFWASLSWNAALCLICGGMALVTIMRMDQDRCYDRQDQNTPRERLEACTSLLAEEDLTDDERADIFAARGHAYHASGEYRSALRDYDTAITLDPEDSYSLYNRALIKERLGKKQDAINDYDRSLKLRPDNHEAYLHRGVLLLHRGKFDQAIADFDAARQFGGGDEWPIVYRGLVYAAKNDRMLAERDFATVKRINPNNALMLRGEAWLDMQDGNYRDAVLTLNRALQSDPDDLSTLKMRAEAYWQMGDEAKSRSDEDRIWELSDPDLPSR